MARRRERQWNSGPVMASVVLHGAVVALLAFSGGDAPEPPKTKIYAVDIVSPPPTMAGAPPTQALSNQEPGPAASPAPAAETPPAPEPAPPAPAPEPAPPRAEPKEPAKAPEPRRTPPERPSTPRPPTPAPEKNRPAPATNRPAATPEKNRPATNRPAANRPPATPEKNRPTGGSSTTGGSGTGSTRTRGDGTSTAPATGSNPQANSPGGEGLTIRTSGEACAVAGYCERVITQVKRYFRAPPENAGARGDICFHIQRDGSVTGITTERVRGGGAAFRLAMMEAAEAAGSRRAFGTLPAAFDPQRTRWCVELFP